MGRKTRRIVSLMLVLVLAVALLGTPGQAASQTQQMEQQIIRTYQKALSYFGRSTFHGYCATFVSIQMLLLGICATTTPGNGNEQFDYFRYLSTTSGGYQIDAYPAAQYTLLEALEEITDHGTKDVGYVLVGFQKTRTTEGSVFGHSMLIYGIVDGRVYFSESYDMTLNGRYYPEGAPMSCTIEEFAAYYDRSTVEFDGVIVFREPTYADECQYYPSHLEVSALGGTLWSQPCTAGVDESSAQVRGLTAGERLEVTGLYQNTQGEYWYQIGDEGYVSVGRTQLEQVLYNDVQVTEASAPTMLHQGRGYQVTGRVQAGHTALYTVRAQVYRLEEDGQTQALSQTETVDGTAFDLDGSALAEALAFRKLTTGQYRYDLAAIVANNYIQGGRLQTGYETVTLWSSEFQVVDQSGDTAIVTFDPQGGAMELDQTAVILGEPVGALPVPTLEGYVFQGWYTEDGAAVDPDAPVSQDMTLCAHWIAREELEEAWQDRGVCLYYYSDGTTANGCVQIDGNLYYFSSIADPAQGDALWTAVAGA